MKYATVRIAVEDKDLLGKEIEEMIHDRLKQMTREEMDAALSKELDRLVQSKLKSIENPWETTYKNMAARVAESAEKYLAATIEEKFDLNSIVERAIERAMRNNVPTILNELVDQAVTRYLRAFFTK